MTHFPLAPSRAAALHYRDRWQWPAFASTYAVWLRLPANMAAVSVVVPQSRLVELLSILDHLTGPVIDYSRGRYAILTHCVTLDPNHISADERDAPVAHLGVGSSIDLPPSVVVGDTRATWLREPANDEPLPDCVKTLVLVRHLLLDQ